MTKVSFVCDFSISFFSARINCNFDSRMPATNGVTSKSRNGYNICYASHRRKRCLQTLFPQPSTATGFGIGTSFAQKASPHINLGQNQDVVLLPQRISKAQRQLSRNGTLLMISRKHVFKLVAKQRMCTVDSWSSCGVSGVICHFKKSRNVCNFICLNLSNPSRF